MTNSVSDSIRAAATAWISLDPDPVSRQIVTDLLAEGSEALRPMFEGRIEFGTAGLRAEMMPGPNGMNRLVVRQTTAGLMRWLPKGAKVVIGYDARHHSEDFAHDVARVVAGAGGRAELLPGPLPTPVLAFAVLERQADAGVMITASHNPPRDNGYKLYLGDGIQLVSPADTEVAAAIDDALKDPLVLAGLEDDRIQILGNELAQAHIDACVAACTTTNREIEVVYSAMHGVGGEHMVQAFTQAGFRPPTLVEEQFQPDPDFPTVAFPNPEEDGALDLALDLARTCGADVVVANDPDADRLALALRRRAEEIDGPSHVGLSGDEVGILLADHLIRSGSGPDRIVSNSLVSSRLVQEMAKTAGIQSEVTLTGFKWVARPIVERPELEFVLGYEEALGYCVGSAVRDKDGISAALVAAEMLATMKKNGLTVWDRLDELAAEHGVYLTGPVTVRLTGSDGIAKRRQLMAGIQTSPPADLGGSSLESMTDLTRGETLPVAEGVVLHYRDRTRVIVRPSGTEPKLKGYIEVIESVGNGAVGPARRDAKQRLVRYQRELTAYFDANQAT